MWGGGDFNRCEGRIRPFFDDTLEYVSESIMLQKTRGARAVGELNKGKFLRCNHTHQLCPVVVTGPENAVSRVERRHSAVAPVIGGRVCFVVGDEDGNRSLFLAFLKNKRLPYFLKHRAARNFKKSELPTYQLIFISSPPTYIVVYPPFPNLGKLQTYL